MAIFPAQVYPRARHTTRFRLAFRTFTPSILLAYINSRTISDAVHLPEDPAKAEEISAHDREITTARQQIGETPRTLAFSDPFCKNRPRGRISTRRCNCREGLLYSPRVASLCLIEMNHGNGFRDAVDAAHSEQLKLFGKRALCRAPRRGPSRRGPGARTSGTLAARRGETRRQRSGHLPPCRRRAHQVVDLCTPPFGNRPAQSAFENSPLRQLPRYTMGPSLPRTWTREWVRTYLRAGAVQLGIRPTGYVRHLSRLRRHMRVCSARK